MPKAQRNYERCYTAGFDRSAQRCGSRHGRLNATAEPRNAGINRISFRGKTPPCLVALQRPSPPPRRPIQGLDFNEMLPRVTHTSSTYCATLRVRYRKTLYVTLLIGRADRENTPCTYSSGSWQRKQMAKQTNNFYYFFELAKKVVFVSKRFTP